MIRVDAGDKIRRLFHQNWLEEETIDIRKYKKIENIS